MKSKVTTLLIILVLIGIILLQVNILPILGQGRTVGVEAGDWFKYDSNVNWDSDKPDADPPAFAYSEDETDWVFVEVVSVSGTNITYERTYHFFDGEEKTELLWTDVTILSQYAFFIPANHTLDDLVAVLGFYFYLNQTISRNYGGIDRDVNYGKLGFSAPSTFAGYLIPYPHNVSTIIDIYWDKHTGVLTEYYLFVGGEIEDGAFTYNVNYSLHIIDSNHSEIPEFTSLIILPILMVATLVITLYKKRLH